MSTIRRVEPSPRSDQPSELKAPESLLHPAGGGQVPAAVAPETVATSVVPVVPVAPAATVINELVLQEGGTPLETPRPTTGLVPAPALPETPEGDAKLIAQLEGVAKTLTPEMRQAAISDGVTLDERFAGAEPAPTLLDGDTARRVLAAEMRIEAGEVTPTAEAKQELRILEGVLQYQLFGAPAQIARMTDPQHVAKLAPLIHTVSQTFKKGGVVDQLLERSAASKNKAARSAAEGAFRQETDSLSTDQAKDPATAASEDVVIPAPEITKSEQAWLGIASTFAEADVMMLAQIVMLQVAKDHEKDLRELLHEMQEIAKQKKLIRERITEAKAMKNKARQAATEEYRQRTSLNPNSDLYVNGKEITLDQFIAERKVNANTHALLDSDAPARIDLSKNMTMYNVKTPEIGIGRLANPTESELNSLHAQAIADGKQAFADDQAATKEGVASALGLTDPAQIDKAYAAAVKGNLSDEALGYMSANFEKYKGAADTTEKYKGFGQKNVVEFVEWSVSGDPPNPQFYLNDFMTLAHKQVVDGVAAANSSTLADPEKIKGLARRLAGLQFLAAFGQKSESDVEAASQELEKAKAGMSEMQVAAADELIATEAKAVKDALGRDLERIRQYAAPGLTKSTGAAGDSWPGRDMSKRFGDPCVWMPHGFENIGESVKAGDHHYGRKMIQEHDVEWKGPGESKTSMRSATRYIVVLTPSAPPVPGSEFGDLTGLTADVTVGTAAWLHNDPANDRFSWNDTENGKFTNRKYNSVDQLADFKTSIDAIEVPDVVAGTPEEGPGPLEVPTLSTRGEAGEAAPATAPNADAYVFDSTFDPIIKRIDQAPSLDPADARLLYDEIYAAYPKKEHFDVYASWMCKKLTEKGMAADKVTALQTSLASTYTSEAATREAQAKEGASQFNYGEPFEGSEEKTFADIDTDIERMENKKDALGDLTEQMQIKVQLAMDRRAKMLEMLSNMMKKVSQTGENIIGNIK